MKYDKDVEAFMDLDRTSRKRVIEMMFSKWRELQGEAPEKASLFLIGLQALDALHHQAKGSGSG